MKDRIDIHSRKRKFESALRNVELDETMNKRNKELLLKFTWDCRLGKTIKKRSKKKIGRLRVMKYLYMVRNLSAWLGKPFDEATQEDIDKLVFDIEEDVYKKDKGQNYSENTKLDYKKVLIKFYKWLGRADLMESIDTSEPKKDVPALERDEVDKIISYSPTPKMKAAIMVLFDSGARAEEFLNLRIKDLTTRKYENENECYYINIRYSKTEPRNIPIPLSAAQLNEWLELHPDRDNPDAQLFPMTYQVLKDRLRRVAERILKKRVTPHMLRHSSATYWAPKMNHFEFCAKYGWAFGSKMPDKYIKRKGIIFDKVAEKGDVDRVSKLKKENMDLKENFDTMAAEHKKIWSALKFMMPMLMEKMDNPDAEMKHEIRTRLFEAMKEQQIQKQREEKPLLEGPEFRLMT